MEIIYIVSLIHSGSTLLDLMLNAHSMISSVGELWKLSERWGWSDSQCCCGAPALRQCAFWLRVNEIVSGISGKSLSEINVSNYRDRGSFQADNPILFRAISEVTASEYIVDSSKDVRRLESLLKIRELNVFPIFLVRDPKGQICSVKTKYSGLFRHILQYNRRSKRIHKLLGDRPHAIVRYEQLVQEPELALGAVLGKLGLRFEPRQLRWTEPVKHHFAGNRMRWQSESQLLLDQRWEKELSRFEKFAIDVGTLGVRRHLAKAMRFAEEGGERSQ